MRRIVMMIAVLTVVAAGSAVAQAFMVSYLDGTVEVQSARGWTPVSIGDRLPADARVRISEQGSLELVRPKGRITLLKDGVYSIAALSRSASPMAGGVGSSIAQKLHALVTERPNASAAGGVRGSEQGTASVTWVDESDETRSQAQALLDKKSWRQAADLLTDAIANSPSETDTAEFTYLLGVAYYGEGQTARAYRTLSKVSPDPDAIWYARFLILKAQVLVDAQGYTDALALLGPFIASYPTGEATQIAWLLSGISQKGLGNTAAARTDFDTGYAMNPASDTARLIDEQRREL